MAKQSGNRRRESIGAKTASNCTKKVAGSGNTCVAQSVKCLTLDFSSGVSLSHTLGSTLTV